MGLNPPCPNQNSPQQSAWIRCFPRHALLEGPLGQLWRPHFCSRAYRVTSSICLLVYILFASLPTQHIYKACHLPPHGVPCLTSSHRLPGSELPLERLLLFCPLKLYHILCHLASQSLSTSAVNPVVQILHTCIWSSQSLFAACSVHCPSRSPPMPVRGCPCSSELCELVTGPWR